MVVGEPRGRHVSYARANRVGLAGSSMGGGFGTINRFLGTPADFLHSVEYTLYNITIVKASRKENADLFLVAQGAGSSYVTLLSLTIKTWKPEHERVTNFTISLPADISIETGVEALLAVQDHAQIDAPDTFAIRWQLATPLSGSGYFYSAAEDFNSIIAPLIERLPSTTTFTTSTEDFWTMENTAIPSLNGTTDTLLPRSMYFQAYRTETREFGSWTSGAAVPRAPSAIITPLGARRWPVADPLGGSIR